MGLEDFIIRLLKTEQTSRFEVLIVALMNFLILWDVNTRLAATDISNILSAYLFSAKQPTSTPLGVLNPEE